jgi:hypothetical protein
VRESASDNFYCRECRLKCYVKSQAFHQVESENQLGLHQVRKSQESYTSDGDGDSGVGPDSTGSRYVVGCSSAIVFWSL